LTVAAPLAEAFGVHPFWFATTAVELVVVLLRRFVPAIYYIEGGLPQIASAPQIAE
jgi:hypothetical protein